VLKVAGKAIEGKAEKHVVGASVRPCQSGLELWPRLKRRTAYTGVNEVSARCQPCRRTNSFPRSSWVSIEAGVVDLFNNARKAGRA
jgi:hypothetical protein